MESSIKRSYKDKTIPVGLQAVSSYKTISMVTIYLKGQGKKMQGCVKCGRKFMEFMLMESLERKMDIFLSYF